MKNKQIIGIIEPVSIGRRVVNIPAKIDTGADSSSIWASNIRIDQDGSLKFSLFGEGSPYYNGKIFRRTDFSVAQVRSSNGTSQIRYRTHFSVKIAGRKIKVLFNLSDRSKNTYKVLIGRRTISNKFIVDVSRGIDAKTRAISTHTLRKELAKSPQEFHNRHMKGGQK